MSEILKIVKSKHDVFITIEALFEGLLFLEKELIELRGLLSDKITWKLPEK